MSGTAGAAAATAGGGTERDNGSKIKVPVFDGASITMKKYKRQVAIWEIGTDVAEAKRGANLLAALTGKAEEACEELDESTLKGSDGVKTFLEYLSSKFPEIDVIDTPEVLTQFVKPACFRLRNEEIRDFNNRFNNLVTKLKAKKISVPDELVAFLYMAGARLPTERQASVLNGVGNVYETQKLQNALMVNLPEGGRPRRVIGSAGWLRERSEAF